MGLWEELEHTKAVTCDTAGGFFLCVSWRERGAPLDGQLGPLLPLVFFSLLLPRLSSLSAPVLPCFAASPRQLDSTASQSCFPCGAAAAPRRREPQPRQERVPSCSAPAGGCAREPRSSQHTRPSAQLMLTGRPGYSRNAVPVFCFALSCLPFLSPFR